MHTKREVKSDSFINEANKKVCDIYGRNFSMLESLLKRGSDLLLAVCVLIIIFPPLLIIITCVNLLSPTHRYPVFFTQKRTGLYGKTFTCYKFRSMKINVDADTKQASENDPRITKFGAFLRNTSLDEIPQFLNVLIGNMSIVGPRPHMLKHTIEYAPLIPDYMKRHCVKPGVTGLAQITGFRGETKELRQMEERVNRDLWYIKNRSLWLDFKIIIYTPFSIFGKSKFSPQ